jgi:hypothetical protein
MPDKIPVYALFVGTQFVTALWVSEEVLDDVLEYRNQPSKKQMPAAMVVNKLDLYCKAGFHRYEGKRGEPICPESGETHRIGHPKSLYRIYGFFEDATKRSFIAISPNMKRGTKMSRPDREMVEYVAQIKAEKSWSQEKPDGT